MLDQHPGASRPRSEEVLDRGEHRLVAGAGRQLSEAPGVVAEDESEGKRRRPSGPVR